MGSSEPMRAQPEPGPSSAGTKEGQRASLFLAMAHQSIALPSSRPKLSRGGKLGVTRVRPRSRCQNKPPFLEATRARAIESILLPLLPPWPDFIDVPTPIVG